MSQVTGSTQGSDALSWLGEIVDGGEVTEVFVKGLRREGLNMRVDLTGYYDGDHLPALVNDALECSGRAVAVLLINPVNPVLLDPVQQPAGLDAACGRRDQRGHHAPAVAAADGHRPQAARWRLGHGGEDNYAKDAAQRVHKFLREQGWPAPTVIDSGNGYYLIYHLDLPPDDDGGLVRRLLRALGARFSDGHAQIDTTVHDAARPARLPDTLNCKSDSLPDRHHHRAVFCGFLQAG